MQSQRICNKTAYKHQNDTALQLFFYRWLILFVDLTTARWIMCLYIYLMGLEDERVRACVCALALEIEKE